MPRLNSFTLRSCTSEADFDLAIRLTRDYLRWLDLDLAYQGIDNELAHFAGMYGPPSGLFLLALDDNEEVAGGVGLRTLEPGICEMKRLYVYDRHKGQGVGRLLCEELLRRGRGMGFGIMRLDTLEQMAPALALYERLGFYEIDPYCSNPFPGARYLQYDL